MIWGIAVLAFAMSLFACETNSTEKTETPNVQVEHTHNFENGVCTICQQDENVYVVVFYSSDGKTILSEQTVLSGEEFTLPKDNSKRNLLGYFKWDGTKWGDTYIPLSEFEKPDGKKVDGDLKFKAEYEWTPISK